MHDPAAIAEIDHLQGYARGGPTNASNARIKCKRHNLFAYRNGYTVTTTHGRTHTTRQDGTQMKPPDAA